MTFNSFLRDKHADQYIGVDDDMSDDFDQWYIELLEDNKLCDQYTAEWEQLEDDLNEDTK